MSAVSELLWTYAENLEDVDRSMLMDCIDACVECVQACTACADACLSDRDVGELTRCIRANLDCADICDSTARVLTRHSGYDTTLLRSVLEGCAVACRTCAAECELHADDHRHCEFCARACRLGEEACNALIASLA